MAEKQNRDDEERGSMTTHEAGEKGVEALREKYGPQAMQEIGRKGGEARSDDPDIQSGETGRKGGQRVKELVEEGKRAEQEKS